MARMIHCAAASRTSPITCANGKLIRANTFYTGRKQFPFHALVLSIAAN
jgi:hypothetical protein